MRELLYKSGAGIGLALLSPAVLATLSNRVSSFSLDYRDGNNCQTTLKDNSVGTADCTTKGGIRSIVITLTVDDATGQNVQQRTRVSLRNT